MPKKTPKKTKKAETKSTRPDPGPLQEEQEPQPVLSRAESSAQIREILDRLFDGNAAEIVKTLADSGELSPGEMARMKEVFAKSKGRRNK